MRLFTVVIAVVAVLFAAARLSHAESPSPETLAAARELVATVKATDNFKKIFPSMMQAMKPVIAQGRPAVEKDFDVIASQTTELFNSRLSDLAELIAQIYARNFTANEMREIQAFYQTPTGQKVVQATPLIAQQSLLVGQEWGKSLAADLRARITDELRKRGHDI
jgi:hypothetical protein